MTRTLPPLVVALVTLGDPGQLTGGYLFHRRLAELAPAEGARLDFVSFPSWPFPLPALAGGRVLGAARAVGANAIVLDSIAAAFLAPWLAVSGPPVPMLAMLHQPPGGIDHGPARAAVQATLDRLAYRRARRLLLASDSLADEMLTAGTPRDRVRVVPPGRDVAGAAAPAPPPGDLRKGHGAAFLCVGNWVARKGIHSLLEAFARLPADAGTLHLAGATDLEPAYAAQLRALLATPELARRVIVHGPLSVAEVAALYAAADVFVLPSLKEPYGTVYGEAMAAGLPVVGWRTGNLPYLAEHEREGLLIEPGNLAGLSEALLRLARDEPLRRRMGDASRERAATRPTWREVAGLFFGEVRAALS
jgi:glycosyltransferase involved in cell wall biosynthesis